jgi:hypothetical protein
MNQDIAVITRSFQRGAKLDSGFDQGRFYKSVVAPIVEVLKSNRVSLLTIVTCGGGDSGKYAEEVVDGETPTTRAVQTMFPAEVKSGRIKTVVCMNWGLNAGSATALNEGLTMASFAGVPYIMNWSPELKVHAEHLAMALGHMERHALDVCGFLRSLHWFKPQWQVPQNTGAIWRTDRLKNVDGFSEYCNGDGKTVVKTSEYGDVSLAGMEDYEAILRMHKADSSGPRLGMTCRASPLPWDLANKKAGTAEYDDNMKKIARQWEVMKAYTAQHFSDEPFEGVFMRVMGQMQFD